MYDAWAAYDETARAFLLGQAVGRFGCPYQAPEGLPVDVEAAREKAMSFAAYRLLLHRFANSPLPDLKVQGYNRLMNELGFDTEFVSDGLLFGRPRRSRQLHRELHDRIRTPGRIK